MKKKNGMFQGVSVRASVAAILGATAAGGYQQLAFAADTEELQEVAVTGSRILRPDLESNSPFVAVDKESFEARTGLNVESYLNQLPAFNPATTPTTQQFDVQITPVNSVGISSISLRGFGPNRNLVLVDGHRSMPINALMVTDINYIPSALIERVEIISGGASAVYGADAIGGVTNFITRNNFQGAEFDVQYGVTEQGDGEQTRAYALLGTNFADGRGNITMEAEVYDRKFAEERKRDFYTKSWADPLTGGDFFVFGYNGFNSAFSFNPPSEAALNSIFVDRPVYGTAADNGAPDGPGNGIQTGVRNFGNSFGIFEGFRFNKDGTVFATGSGNNLYKYTEGGGIIDGFEFARQQAYDLSLPGGLQGQVMDTLKWNNVDAYVSAPQKRHSFYASGTYDFTDSLTFFSRATFAESKTRTRLFPANASFGWEASIPYNPATDSPLNPALAAGDIQAALADPTNPLYANPNYIPTGAAGAQHPVTPEFAVLLNSRAPANTYCLTGLPGCGAPFTGTTATPIPGLVGQPVPGTGNLANWILETYPSYSFDDRATFNTNTVFQLEGGLRFDIPVKDWTGELYFSHGESSTYNLAYGNNSLTRWRALVTQPDYGRGAAISGNQGGASVGFGAADITCQSGFYNMIFAGDARPSEDCRTAVIANLQTRTNNKQEIAELNFQGGLFNLPAGELRGAAGFQYRKNWAQFIPDILQSTSSFTDQVIGVYPTGYLDASTSVKDVYAELLVPVLSDLPFLKKLELELGGRYSDYADTDSTTTYKATANLEFNDYFRLRGGYNRATRAPNLGELFLNVQEIFATGGNFSDPCGFRSNAPYGAGGAGPDPIIPLLPDGVTPAEPPTQLAAGQTAAGAQSTYLICQAQMGTAGNAAFYGPTTNQAAPGPGGGFAWILQRGNPDLDSEEADTWTAGVVFTSHAESPWLSSLTASVDWYKVDINNAIQQYSTDYAAFLCYGTVQVTDAAGAAAQAGTRQCQNVGRNAATGGPTTALIEYDNQATISTSGIDIGVNWMIGFGDVGWESIPGRFGVNIQASVLDYYKTKQSPTVFDVETDWKGSLGPNLSGTNPGAYDYRVFTSFSYVLEDISISLRWRHLPEVDQAAKASENAIIANNNAVAAGAPGIVLSYTPTTVLPADSYNIFDLSANWNINQTLSIRAGIDNLFDVEPKITGASAGRPYDPSLTAAQNTANLAAVCSAAQRALGCVAPTGFSLPNSGAGLTNGGYYDTLGRSFFVGVKARF